MKGFRKIMSDWCNSLNYCPDRTKEHVEMLDNWHRACEEYENMSDAEKRAEDRRIDKTYVPRNISFQNEYGAWCSPHG
jgi:DnaJ-class molecular chaperone